MLRMLRRRRIVSRAACRRTILRLEALTIEVRGDTMHVFPTISSGFTNHGRIELTSVGTPQSESLHASLRAALDGYRRDAAILYGRAKTQTGPRDGIGGQKPPGSVLPPGWLISTLAKAAEA
jgi:hypothetical protein